MSKISQIRIEFALEEGQSRQHPACDYGSSVHIQLQPEVCGSCGQDHKANVELNLWEGPNGPNEKSRHTSFAAAYAAAKS